MITKTPDFCLKMQKKQRFKDVSPPQKHKKPVKWIIFRAQLKIFKLTILSSPLSNFENLSANQIDNLLNFSEHILLLILVPLWREL